MRVIAGLLTLLAVVSATPAAAAAWRVERSVAVEGQVRALAASPQGLVAAGPTADGRAWYGLFDPHTLAPQWLHRPPCRRCALFAAAVLPAGTVVLVGTHQEVTTAPARGWVLVVDPRDGAVLRETTLAGRGPVTLRAVDVGAGRILVGGEAEPGMGADVVGYAALLRAADLAVEAEWPFEGAPRTVQSVRILGREDFLAGGFELDPRSALPGGWLARFGYKGEPFWRRSFPAAEGPEVVALLPEDGHVRILGHRVGFAGGVLRFDVLTALVDADDGRLLRRTSLSGGSGRMAGAALASDEGLLVAAAAGPRGAERAELLHLREDGAGVVADLGQVEGRATLPAALVRTPDGALVLGGRLRGEGAPRGWLARLLADGGDVEEAAGSSLRLDLTCAAGRLRVVLENRGRGPARVRPLRPDTVRVVPAGEAPRPGVIGAMPGRPPAPVEPAVELRPGGRLVLELPLPTAGGVLRAVYSPDFAGHGIGRLLVSPPLDPESAPCRRGSDRGRG